MATAAILIWPLIALILFRRLSAVNALIWGMLVPYLFLPEAFAINIPTLPDLDKTSIIALGAVLGFLTNRQKFRNEATLHPTMTGNRLVRMLYSFCVLLIVVGIVLTVLGNGDSLQYGPRFLPAMRPWDAISMLGDTLFFFTPFFFARKYLSRSETHQTLMSAFVIMGLLYIPLLLIEMRLSPQLHNWVYGYHQHSFLQHVRDGYRPKVFLFHGIWVGFFLFMSIISAFSLWKATKQTKWLLAGLMLFVILFLSRNLAASLITVLGLLIMFSLRQKMQILIALCLGVIVLFYPALRQAQVIPINQIMGAATKISEERAASLLYRLNNEDQLLEKAFERPLAGWGGYAREQLYDTYGRDVSVSEGRWIQQISTRGWIGYFGLFGLLTIPLLFLSRARRRKDVPVETIGLMIIIIGNLIYMIPNSTLTVIGWLVFGALAGFVQFDSQAAPQQHAPKTGSAGKRHMPKNKYTRFQGRQSGSRV